MFNNIRKRLEDSLEAVEALATGTTPGSPRSSGQDGAPPLVDGITTNSASSRHSFDISSPTQHSGPFNYLPYQPRAAAQLADSAMSNLRRSLTLQRNGSISSGHLDNSSQGRKSPRENSPVNAPIPRKAGLSLEERLRANLTRGDTSGPTSPGERGTLVAQTSNDLESKPALSEPSVSLDPTQIQLPPSPVEEMPPKVTAPPTDIVDPASVHLPMSPPHSSAHLSSNHVDESRVQTLSALSVTSHPLSPLPSTPPDQIETSEGAISVSKDTVPLEGSPQAPQTKQAPPRPANIIVDVSTPSSAMATPSEFATAESRSDVTVGSPDASEDNPDMNALRSSLPDLEETTPITPGGALSTGLISKSLLVLPGEPQEEQRDTPKTGAAIQDVDTKLRDRLQVVEERFNGKHIRVNNLLVIHLCYRHLDFLQKVTSRKGGGG